MLIVILVILITMIYDIYFLTKLYIQFLIYLIEHGHIQAFRNFTLGLYDLESFRSDYVYRDGNDNLSEEEEEFTPAGPIETRNSQYDSENESSITIPDKEIEESLTNSIR